MSEPSLTSSSPIALPPAKSGKRYSASFKQDALRLGLQLCRRGPRDRRE